MATTTVEVQHSSSWRPWMSLLGVRVRLRQGGTKPEKEVRLLGSLAARGVGGIAPRCQRRPALAAVWLWVCVDLSLVQF